MGFWHWEVCREKEQLMNRKGKILFLYREVQRPQSLSNSFGGHSPSHSVWPESNRGPSLLNQRYPQASPPQEKVLTVQLIIQTGTMTSFLIPPLIYFMHIQSISRTVSSASRIYSHPPFLAVSPPLREGETPHGQPPLPQSRPQPAPLLFLLLLTTPPAARTDAEQMDVE